MRDFQPVPCVTAAVTVSANTVKLAEQSADGGLGGEQYLVNYSEQVRIPKRSYS